MNTLHWISPHIMHVFILPSVKSKISRDEYHETSMNPLLTKEYKTIFSCQLVRSGRAHSLILQQLL